MSNVSFATKSYVQIYSSSSGHFIQIKKTEVDARGVKGSQYGRDNVGHLKPRRYKKYIQVAISLTWLVCLFVCLFVCLLYFKFSYIKLVTLCTD